MAEKEKAEKKPEGKITDYIEKKQEKKTEEKEHKKEIEESKNNGSDNVIAFELAKKQQEISVAEFFEKNRHLLGFDNKRKALLTAIKEAVDNSLDACEEARILPELLVEIVEMGEEKFRVSVADNGPGIVREQIPNIFAKLLYGSKFHTLKQARGQQGIGISAAALYGQLTTGKPIRIISKISPKHPAYYYELHIDTKNNKPEILKQEEREWDIEHGTRIEIDLEAIYQKGDQSVDEYLKQTAIINPHATITYTNPKAEQFIFARVSKELPAEAKEIKPHPYGVELGLLLKMLKSAEERTLQSFLTSQFSRVGAGTAKEICEKAAMLPNSKPHEIDRNQGEKLIDAIRNTRIIAPSPDCLSPIGAQNLENGLRKEINAEFYTSTARPPSVYRGNPFVIECAIAYGGQIPGDKQATILRFANRVPLLYQQGACAATKSITATNWKSYGLSQSNGAVPVGPCVIAIHLASVWAPFTSEAKEAIAHYPEIIREMKLALQECGRELTKYIHKKYRVNDAIKKKSYIEKYLPHIALALKELLGLTETEEKKLQAAIKELLEKTRQIESISDEGSEEEDNGREKFGIKGNVEEELENAEDSDDEGSE
ncbi:MAG: DNA topoisomerase VI subunit B [Candidatus Woesearchaeota archaeon]|nr:DNA topoisomerase VI subunit B [Candidatus Woesearchaeota archaeon]